MDYSKPPLCVEDQVRLLKSRGLIIEDEEFAKHILSNISYYRFRAYTEPFQDTEDPNHPFVTTITFEEVHQLYVFDRKLRLYIFDALEKIEVALRTKLINTYALATGDSHWHEKEENYKESKYFQINMDCIEEEVTRSKEKYIDHYKATYSYPELPPSWMTLEVVSLKSLAFLYKNLKNDKHKSEIAIRFGLAEPDVLETWLLDLVELRNSCAHHGRIWNRMYSVDLKIPKIISHVYLKNSDVDKRRLYLTLSNMLYLMRIITPNTGFSSRIKKLFDKYPIAKGATMGFPVGWENEELWKD